MIRDAGSRKEEQACPRKTGGMALWAEGPTPARPMCAGEAGLLQGLARGAALGPVGAREGSPGPLGGSRRRVQGAARLRPSPQQPVDEEAERQQASAQQVTQPREVRDAVVVRVQGLPPRQPNRHVRQVQQDRHLCGERWGDSRAGGAAGLWLEVLMGVPSRPPCRPGSPQPEACLCPKPRASSTSPACQKPVWKHPVHSQGSGPEAACPGHPAWCSSGRPPGLPAYPLGPQPCRRALTGPPPGPGQVGCQQKPTRTLRSPWLALPITGPSLRRWPDSAGEATAVPLDMAPGPDQPTEPLEAGTTSCLSRDPSQAGARWPPLPGPAPPAGTGAQRSCRLGPPGFLAGRRRRRRPSGRAPRAAAGRGPTWR